MTLPQRGAPSIQPIKRYWAYITRTLDRLPESDPGDGPYGYAPSHLCHLSEHSHYTIPFPLHKYRRVLFEGKFAYIWKQFLDGNSALNWFDPALSGKNQH